MPVCCYNRSMVGVYSTTICLSRASTNTDFAKDLKDVKKYIEYCYNKQYGEGEKRGSKYGM